MQFTGSVCIVGITGLEKQTLRTKLESAGATITSSVSKSTLCLVTTKQNSSKAKTNALLFGKPIYEPSEVLQILNTNIKETENDHENDNYEEESIIKPADEYISPQKKVKISHSSYPHQHDSILQSDLKDFLSFPFLDRETTSLELAKALCLQKIDQKGVLPILSQHFGSGKTTLVQNFRKVLKPDALKFPHFKTLMEAVLVEIDLKFIVARVDKSSIVSSMNSEGAMYDEFFRMLRIALEDELRIKSDNERVKKSYQIFSHYIYLVTGVTNPSTDATVINLATNLKKNDENIMKFLHAWHFLELVPLILFFDELSAIQKSVEDRESIIRLWEFFYPLFGLKCISSVFMVVAGKSSALTLLGRNIAHGSLTPTPAKHIVLDLLKQEHVIQLMEQTVVTESNKSMESLLKFCNIGKELPYFYKLTYEYSGGIPRIITSVIRSIVSYCTTRTLDLSSRESIDATFRNETVMAKVFSLQEINPLSFLKDHPSFKIYQNLCIFAELGIPINIDEKTISLVYDLNIGLAIEEGHFKLSIPKFIDWASEQNLELSILKKVFSHGFSSTVEKGAALEVLTRNNLVLRCMFYMSQKEISNMHECFSLSKFLAGQKIELNIQDPIKFMPKVVTKGASPKTVDEIISIADTTPWEYNVIDTDWPKLKPVFFNNHCFVHPAPKSRSSDLFFSIPPNRVICFAIKNYPNITFTFQMLQEEIDKAYLMTQSKDNNSFDFVSLFVICYRIQTSPVHEYCKTKNCLVFSDGTYSTYEGTIERLGDFKPTFKLLRNTPNDIRNYGKNGTIFVPKNMEVIVLGEKAINTFFTKEELQQLSILATQTYPSIDYLKNFVPLSFN